MADFNTSETMDVDVETVMGMIRRRINHVPDARYIMSAVESARLKADSIVTGTVEVAGTKAEGDVGPRPAPMGWKNRMKARVAALIIRAVKINFRYQQGFNNSVVRVLQLMAEDLYVYERRLGAAGHHDAHGSAHAAIFDRAAFAERYLDAKAFCRLSLSLFREMLREDDVALSLFCGRGELLAAFAENGIAAAGVDPDAEMVRQCRTRGLRALQANILEHLRESPDGSYGGIFAWKVVERLTADQTAELLELAVRKLKHGGLFVASATNVDHIPALREFYLDPSLVRPVPARLLGFMVEQSGLKLHHFRFFSAGANGGNEELSEPILSGAVNPYDEYTVVAVND